MRRTTITILAVTAVTLASACGGASESVDQPTKQELATEGPANSAGGDTSTSPSDQAPASPPGATKEDEAASAPAPAPAVTCELDELNQELSNMPLEDAVGQHERFRCLCDDQGYPLVGNINAKGTKASLFCPELKEQGLL